MNLAEQIDAYCAARAAEGISPATVLWYGDHLNRFRHWVDEQTPPPDLLDRKTIETYYAARRAAGLQPETVAGDHRTLRIFYRWLIERGEITTSPVEGIKLRKPKRKTPKRATIAEYEQMLASIDPVTWIDLRDRLLISMLFLCGVRVGEAVGVQVPDFDVRTKLLLVNGKTGPRVVPLLPAVIENFVAYLYTRPSAPSAHLFLSAKGDLSVRDVIKPNGVRQMLMRRADAAGIRYINPHAFRHGLAMHLLNKGGDMSLVQRILGHTRITTTAENYAMWLTDDMSREFAKKMQQ